MHPKRRKRLLAVVFVVVGAGAAIGLLLLGLGENVNMFYPPEEVVSGKAPVDRNIRAGGMVLEGSWRRGEESLYNEFVLTDRAGSEFTVEYDGIVPDLFREGQGIIVEGRLDRNRRFTAERVLAKHDENYMPPELVDMHEGTGG
jgi:cytochrome c-type biogenesis protein CcmE